MLPARSAIVVALVALIAVRAAAAKSAGGHGASSAANLMYPKCITTPAEYAAVFANPDPQARNRCLDRDLIGVIAGSDSVANSMPAVAQGLKLLYFWGGHDALEKYLRIGFPQTVGYWTADPNTEAFPGLARISNGQALLANIGFAAVYADTSSAYTLTVASAKAVRRLLDRQQKQNPFVYGASFGPAPPTAANMIAAYNTALGDFGVSIPPALATLLSTKTFYELSGCRAQCAYGNPGFPESATVPVLVGDRDAGGKCVAPPGAGAQIAPNFIAYDTFQCSERWNELQARYAKPVEEEKGCTKEAVVSGAKLLAADLADAKTDLDKAVAVRAFSIQTCFGDFNPLITYVGYTATGFGGMWSQTVSEFVTSPFQWDKLASSAYRVIDFCISGNGAKPVGGKC
jgi:hypothetical protein